MKSLLMHFEDKEYEILEAVKPEGMSWKQFFMTAVIPKNDTENIT